MRNIFGKGRYATVASTLALVLALSGAAYAANTVRSIDIVDNTIRSVDIQNGQVGAADIGPSAVVPIDIAPNSFGRSPRMWAQVGSGGGAAQSSGLVTSSRTGTGVYSVTWNRNVVSCAVHVTPFNSGPRMATYTASGASISVFLWNGGTGTLVDSDFDVAVFC